MNNKFFFIQKAIELNIFNSSHFIWMDFGINHVATHTEYIHQWIHCVPDLIRQMCINPYIESPVVDKQFFNHIYHHMAGGLFSGSKSNMLLYCDLFKRKTEQIYNENWYQLDEAVMTMVHRENSTLFELYYGDYANIICNYLEPVNNIKHILTLVTKALRYNNTFLAFTILQYCSSYFKHNRDINDICTYVGYHIIADYYQTNGRRLVNDAIYFINYYKKDEKMVRLIQNNKSNLSFYANRHLLI